MTAREESILNTLKHPNIVSFLGVSTPQPAENTSKWLVVKCYHPDLSRLFFCKYKHHQDKGIIDSCSKRSLSEEEVSMLVKQILEALSEMQERNITHR